MSNTHAKKPEQLRELADIVLASGANGITLMAGDLKLVKVCTGCMVEIFDRAAAHLENEQEVENGQVH